MNLSGRPSTNEEQQEVVDTLYQKAYDYSLERIREEIADMTQNIKNDRKKKGSQCPDVR